MIDHYPDVAAAHEADDLLFGTVESWVLYVRAKLFSVTFSQAHPRILSAVSRNHNTFAK